MNMGTRLSTALWPVPLSRAMQLNLGIRVLIFLTPKWDPKQTVPKEETTQTLSGASHCNPSNLKIASERLALLQVQTYASDAVN